MGYLVNEVYIVLFLPTKMIESVWSSFALAEAAIKIHSLASMHVEEHYTIISRNLNIIRNLKN